MQESIISNLDDKDKVAAKNNKKIEQKHNFLEQKNTHEKAEKQIVSDILNSVLYEHKKTDELYIEATVDDVLKTEIEIKNENDNFLDTAIGFNKVDLSAANQKKNDFYSELFDAAIDLPPEKIDIDDAPLTEDIFIDDDLFSDTDMKDKDKLNIDNILQQVNHSNICIAQSIVEIKEKNRLKPAWKKFFSDILLPKKTNKSLLKASRAISKKYKNLEQKK